MDPLQPTYMEIAYFVAWLFEETDVSGGTAARCLTAVNHYLADNFIDWHRPRWISNLLKGFRALRPPKLRPKRPMCHIFLDYIFQHFIIKNNVEYQAAWVAILFGYWGGLRPNEFAVTRDSTLLRLRDIRWNPNTDNPKEIILVLKKSKTNRYGSKFEQIAMKCRCGTLQFGKPAQCVVHALKTYLLVRYHRFGRLRPRYPLFITQHNTALKYDKIRRFIKAAISCIADKQNISLDTAYYSPHCLRTGGCTDLSRAGTPAHLVSRFGRWNSDCWKQIYINLDFFDLARLRGETVSDLRANLFLS